MKTKYGNYLLCIFLLIFIIISNVVAISPFITPIIWFILALIAQFISYKPYIPIKDYRGKLKNILILTLIYLIIYYSLGLIFSYSQNIYKFSNVLKNIYLFITIIISKEYIRYLSINSKNNIIMILITILLILSDLSLNNILVNIKDKLNIFEYLFSVIFPVITTNVMYTVICKKIRIYGVLINRVTITLVSLVVPVIPNINWYTTGLVEGLYPIIVIYIINSLYYHKKKVIIPAVYVFIIFILGLFISGVFRIYPLAIMSDSMSPLFNRGDVVIIDRNNNNLKVGDIIEYQKNDILVVYRIVKINDDYYQTKGDNNEYVDNTLVSIKDIKGKYLYRIKYIGIPSVLFSEFLK